MLPTTTAFAERGISAPTSVSVDQANNDVLSSSPERLTLAAFSWNDVIRDNPNDVAEDTSVEFRICAINRVVLHHATLKGNLVLYHETRNTRDCFAIFPAFHRV